MRSGRRSDGKTTPAKSARWLLLVHQLPGTPSNLRVRTWRRLQELGAVSLKQAVYVLPDSAETREDFEWLKAEIDGSGGDAAVFVADNLDRSADAALIDEFRRAAQTAYTELAVELQRARRSTPVRRGTSGRPTHGRRDEIARFRQRLAAIERVDFFSSAGRDRVLTLLADLESAQGAAPREPVRTLAKPQYRNRHWITRPRPGVDRMASAWLIRRFIDPHATFGFVTDVKAVPSEAVAFDMFGAGFGHEGDRCTFEVLQTRFAITDAAVQRLAGIVHDLDLKDHRYDAPETVTLGLAIEGLQLSTHDDAALLEQGIVLFEALYRSFSHAPRRS